MVDKKAQVRAVRCALTADQRELRAALERTVMPLKRSLDRIRAAQKILIKVNLVWPPEKIRRMHGWYQELVDPRFFAEVLKLLKEISPAAEIYCMDSSLTGTESDVSFKNLLNEFDVTWINASVPPIEWYEVPGGGSIFRRYLFSSALREMDAVVSLAKMKSHLYTGVTMAGKNFFGWSPLPPHGRTRSYFHHFIRLPYCMADMAQIANPCLSIVEAVVGQSGREWGGEGRVCETILTGDNWVAVDACGSRLMGHDPNQDWPTLPFRRERNYVKIAAEQGYGPISAEEIDFVSEVGSPVGQFMSDQTDPPEIVYRWRRTACEQALFYQENRAKIATKYAGEYIFLQDGQVVWHGDDPGGVGSRRQLSGDKPDSALWLKFVDPEETEGEHFAVYAEQLAILKQMGEGQSDK